MDLSRLNLKPQRMAHGKLYHHLDEVLKWKRNEYFPPVYVEFNPTDKCQQRCHYCYTEYLGHTKLTFDSDFLVRVFRQMGEAGVKSVQIQGTGEPLLNKATPDAIVAGKEAGLSIALASNGVLLRPEVAERLLPCLEWVRISDVEPTAELYAKSHVVPERQWYSVIENLNAMVELRNRNQLSTIIGATLVLFPYNAPHVVEAVKMVRDIGVDFMHVKPAQQSLHNPEHNWPRDTHNAFREGLEEAKTLGTPDFRVSVRYDDQFDLQEKDGGFVKNFKHCWGLEFEAMIDADGGVYPCLQFWRDPEFCYGNLKEQSFDEIWRSDRRRQVRDKIFYEYDFVNLCRCVCKQSHVSEELQHLVDPPMHVNFL